MRQYFVNGVEVYAQKNTLAYTDQVNERSTCSFVVFNPDFQIRVGMEVEVLEDEELIFKGTVDDYDSTGTEEIYVSISCVDFSQLIDKRVVFDTFENETVEDIAKSLIADFFEEEGITEGNIEGSMTVNKAVFNYINGNVAMNDLAEISGYNWDIDSDKNLNLFDRSTHTAPFELTDTSFNYANFSVKQRRGDYRNRQYVRAGQDVTQVIENERPTPQPDGVSRSFITRFPIARKPRIFVDGNEVDPNDIGVNGIDNNRLFYFSYNSNTISQDFGEEELQPEQTLSITYQGLYPIIVTADEAEQIQVRQEFEGGSGIYEDVVEDQNIDTREAALQFARGKLDKYGLIQSVVTFNTQEKGLKAGQLISIQNSKHNVDGTFLIESVNGRPNGSKMNYAVKALDGQALGGWEQFFKSLIGKGSKLVIRDNEVLVLLNTMSESQGWQEQLQTPAPEKAEEEQGWQEDLEKTVFACPIPQEDQTLFYNARQPVTIGLFPSEDLYPC